MRVKPLHIWWIGAGLFLPSCLIWAYFSVLMISKFGQFGSLDSHGFTRVYLPLLAAVVGFTGPLVSLRYLRTASARVIFSLFAVYSAAMLSWGVWDVRREHYQIGGHDYPNGILVDGHRHYWHLYFTWYFLPYKSIHGYDFD